MHDFYLQPKQFMLWVISLKQIEVFPGWIDVLSLDERERCQRYTFKKDQDQFILSRYVLRLLLSKYLGILPKEIIFEYSSLGKPFLSHSHHEKEIQFNLSRTDELMVIGMNRECTIGIDIESISHIKDLIADESIVTEFERNQMRNYPMHFFWVAKEAYLKMLGCGLLYPLDDIQVDIESNLVIQLSTKQQGYIKFFSYDGKFTGCLCSESPLDDVFLNVVDLSEKAKNENFRLLTV